MDLTEKDACCYWVVIVTYKRFRAFSETLAAVLHQAAPPQRLLVIDNGGDLEVANLCDSLGVPLITPSDNVGPAGGTSIAIDEFVRNAGPDCWLIRVDDDRPPESPLLLGQLCETADFLRRKDRRIGGIGLAGSTMNLKKWRLRSAEHQDSDVRSTYSDVDYLATGFFPCWSFSMLKEVGGFNSDLFFGLTEVDFGLRCRKKNYRLLAIHQEGHTERKQKRAKLKLPNVPTWRYYYSTRNNIYLSRVYAGAATAIRITVVRYLGKILLISFLNPIVARRYWPLFIKAVRHGWSGNLGRKIDPLSFTSQSGLLVKGEMPNT
jgi:GT2 family glycosyltransferase